MRPGAELDAFSERLGHKFARPELLIRALTHASISGPQRPDNQRLEFLGDRVLGLVIAEALLKADTDAHEGKLAPRFNALVRKETCAAVAREIRLGEVLKLGRSEMKSGGRRKEALLGDAMEAVLAAIYLDAGYSSAKAVILRHWATRIASVEQDARDAKTSLQEWAQARKQKPPEYIETAREGPDHAPVFTIEARLESGESAEARAASKRAAEQAAAQRLLDKLPTNETSSNPLSRSAQSATVNLSKLSSGFACPSYLSLNYERSWSSRLAIHTVTRAAGGSKLFNSLRNILC